MKKMPGHHHEDSAMKILVPYDGSPPSQRAVDYSLRIATAVGKPTVEVHLLNVQEADSNVMDFFRRDAAEVAARLVSTLRDAGTKLLEAAARTVEGGNVRAERTVLIGDPAPIIASYVDNQHCDMVVMGTRGLGPVGGLMLGSVASKLIQRVKVPVTLVK
jgi:nucleotide-binding universal stress UspA family protein